MRFLATTSRPDVSRSRRWASSRNFASGRARRVSLYCYSHSAAIWYAGIASKITRLRNLEVWQLPHEQSQALAGMCQRSMQLQISIQDGHVYFSDGQRSVEVRPQALWRGGQ